MAARSMRSFCPWHFVGNMTQRTRFCDKPYKQKISPKSANPKMSDLTPKTRRYPFVRETRGIFAPLILDKIPISMDTLNIKLASTGVEITSQNESLTVCSIDQADPIRVFQIQTKIIENSGGKIIIENIRYIV